MGCSPWGRKESGTTEQLNTHALKQFRSKRVRTFISRNVFKEHLEMLSAWWMRWGSWRQEFLACALGAKCAGEGKTIEDTNHRY